MKTGDRINIRISQIKNIILTVGFVLLLVIPAIQLYITIFPEVESTENRKLANIPKLRLNYMDPFPSRFEKYYNDNFSLRNHLVSWNFYLSSRYLNQSPLPEKVLFGKRNWLYLVLNEFDEYQHTNLMSSQEVDQIKNEMVYRKVYLDDRDVKLYFVIAPIKYSVYPEYLPSGLIPSNKTSRTEEIKDALINNGIKVLDLTDSLISLKGEELLYYKTDNHWNKLGGFYAARAIINEVRKDFPQVPMLKLENYTVRDSVIDGKNLAQMVRMRDYFDDIMYTLTPDTILAKKAIKADYPIPEWFSYPREYGMGYKTSNDTLPKMLFIRDSFGKAVMPYLSECFNKSVYLFDKWQYTANEHIIENEKPDIVVYMVLESFWDGFLKGVEISKSKRNK